MRENVLDYFTAHPLLFNFEANPPLFQFHNGHAALAQQKADLAAMHSPEADYFIEHMLPCYTQNLDELTKK